MEYGYVEFCSSSYINEKTKRNETNINQNERVKKMRKKEKHYGSKMNEMIFRMAGNFFFRVCVMTMNEMGEKMQ